ncbi:MAG TPA: hypothetical protein VNJ01_10485 [Bacteriovoracaceae bacterium]|nr:hypothetical protein [Bacteriovoracaceae bacterium]
MRNLFNGLQIGKLLAAAVLMLSVSNTYAQKLRSDRIIIDPPFEIMPPQPEPMVYIGIMSRPVLEINYEVFCDAGLSFFERTKQDEESLIGACQINGYATGMEGRVKAEWRSNTCFRDAEIHCQN